MPFVRIDVDASRSPAEIKAISEGVYQALIESVNAPPNDLFHVVSRHDSSDLIYSKDYLGIQRSEHFLAIQIFFYAGRTVEQKKAVYKAIVDRLAASPGVRKEDVFISVVEKARREGKVAAED